MQQKRWIRLTLITGGALLLIALCVAVSALRNTESTLEIRATSQGVAIPDGFSVWHHLDANGIRFKSITPQDDILLIKFDSSAQSEAAKEVLYRSLPHGFIIAQQEESNAAVSWFSRLRSESHRLG
ncbi:EnvZ/OmpR regulon moderator MzrA [Atlantibacter hermannii]|uniref:Modulator protein MzrA n=1 Tax=Atlantibacter hermannii NBRC 105704 TaxID=1115512 RepID=H5V5T8_ATLHE|nr:EnvZ/OmpR regulon moderator MzrA [Atlantibacter hermannii]MBW9430117.1 EnvZ/OmpR regulon moderator MzrA [Atlantibacter hermannii]MDU7812551.1 EnvZ/OmpR regulon moderator MzrA [Atlantibacter hermannii]QPS91313.1 EnvZ/OmpR regulon moderator MzrA [Atlantibacter hermannii]VDZ71589.1 EnvZ/OmpR regulon moderator [Atlantibacter hermannii]GAB53346.1 modulator protein MzrA [Atlantibacter hermannii NBRC 105704]